MEQQYYEISSNFTPIFNIALALLKGRGCEELCNIISSAKISVVNPSLTFNYPFFLLSSTLRFSFAVLCTTNFSRF